MNINAYNSNQQQNRQLSFGISPARAEKLVSDIYQTACHNNGTSKPTNEQIRGLMNVLTNHSRRGELQGLEGYLGEDTLQTVDQLKHHEMHINPEISPTEAFFTGVNKIFECVTGHRDAKHYTDNNKLMDKVFKPLSSYEEVPWDRPSVHIPEPQHRESPQRHRSHDDVIAGIEAFYYDNPLRGRDAVREYKDYVGWHHFE